MKKLYLILLISTIPMLAYSQTIENFIFWENDANSTVVDIQIDPFGDLVILGHRGSPIYSLGIDRPSRAT